MSNLTDNLYSFGHTAGQTAHTLLLTYSSKDKWGTISTPLYYMATLGNGSGSSVRMEHFWALPGRYSEWWMKLVVEDPVHVLVETSLIAFVVYMLVFKRARDWKKEMREKLSEQEIDDLLHEWTPEPLGADLSNLERRRVDSANTVVVHAVHGSKITVTDKSATVSDNGTDTVPTRILLNMASHDFLGMGSQHSVKEASRDTLTRYGCGSCGPRGFYGTIDVHLKLEEEMAKFCRTDDAILYSDGASASASTVAAFAKRGDLLVVDEAIYEALQTGVTLSRANVKFFKHNDMVDLRRVLERIQAQDKKIGRKSADQRRFILVEGLYKNYGHVAPIDQLVQLKTEFCYRLIVDESFSFGTLGKYGRGVIEHFGKDIMYHVEIVTISLENSLGSVGGVCVGNFEVVDHQRLSGAGYCFSAASPPFTASAAIQSLLTLKSDHSNLLTKLENNRKQLYEGLRSIPQLKVTSDDLSSIAFLQLANKTKKTTSPKTTTETPSISSSTKAAISLLTREEEIDILDRVASTCLEKGVAIVSTGHVGMHMHIAPPPSLRLTVTAVHSKDDVDLCIRILKQAVQSVFES